MFNYFFLLLFVGTAPAHPPNIIVGEQHNINGLMQENATQPRTDFTRSSQRNVLVQQMGMQNG